MMTVLPRTDCYTAVTVCAAFTSGTLTTSVVGTRPGLVGTGSL